MSDNNQLYRGSYIRKAGGLAKSPTAPIGAPIAFTADSPLLVPGESFVFDTERLQPTYRQPYYIDEVRFRFKFIGPQDSSISPDNASGMFNFLFQAGGEKISKVPVPAWLYCPRWGTYESYQNLDPDERRWVSYCRWLLPEPLWMGPGDVMHASVQRDLDLGRSADPMMTNITYMGRTLPPGTPPPSRRVIPWVSHMTMIRPNSQLAGTPQAIKSANEEFRNPFMVPLHVQRFIVRGAWGATSDYQEANGSYFVQGPNPETAVNTIELVDSLGYVAAPKGTLLGAALEPDRRAWTFERTIGPREALYPTIKVERFDFVVLQLGMIASRAQEL